MLCRICTLLPLVRRCFREIRAPWALMARVAACSSKGLFCGSVPRMRTPTCMSTRWLRRRAVGFAAGFGIWLMTVSPIQLYAESGACRGVPPKEYSKRIRDFRTGKERQLLRLTAWVAAYWYV